MEHLADDDVPELEDFSEEFKKIRKNQNNLAEKCSEIPINVIEDSKVEKVNKIIKSDQTQNKSEKTIKKEEEFGSGLFKKGFLKKQNNTVTPKTNTSEVKDLTHIKSNAEMQPKQKLFEEFKNEIKNNNGDKGSLLSDIVNKKDEWMTPDLLSKITKNPNLIKYFMDPKFSEIIGMMQKDPQKAIAQFGHIPEFNEFIKEFSKLMGTHFENLGKQSEQKQIQNQFENFDEETQEILRDPKIVPILQKLQSEGKLDIEEIQKDPYLSVKIKTLIDKGVFRVQRESELNKK